MTREEIEHRASDWLSSDSPEPLWHWLGLKYKEYRDIMLDRHNFEDDVNGTIKIS